MNPSNNDLPRLFQQLGLDSGDEAMRKFITEHRVPHGMPVCDASFWNPSQSEFLREALDEDSDWAEAVDSLAVLLTDPGKAT